MSTLQDLREAITAGSGASALIPKIISPLLTEYVRKFAPLRTAFPRQTWESDVFYFNQRNGLPFAQFVTEVPPLTGAGSVSASNSTYAQKSFNIKHLQANGDLSKFAQKVAKVNGSLLALELEGTARNFAWLQECGYLYGCAAATASGKRPQFDGLEMLCASANKIDAAGIKTNGIFDFSMLDALIDTVRAPYAANLPGEDFFFVASPRIQTAATQKTMLNMRVEPTVRPLQPRTDGGVFGNPVTTVTADPGIECMWYRGIPIVMTSFTGAIGTMGAVSAGAQGTSTTPFLQNDVRKYVMAAVHYYGMTLCSGELSVTVSASGNTVTMTWSTPTILDPFGNTLPILSYWIYESGTPGANGTTAAETLLAVVPANNPTTDAAVTGWTDTGAASTSASDYYQYGVGGDGVSYPLFPVSGNANYLGMERIYLCTRDPELCVVPAVNDTTTEILAPVNARSIQYALTADETLALRTPYFMAALERVRFA